MEGGAVMMCGEDDERCEDVPGDDVEDAEVMTEGV